MLPQNSSIASSVCDRDGDCRPSLIARSAQAEHPVRPQLPALAVNAEAPPPPPPVLRLPAELLEIILVASGSAAFRLANSCLYLRRLAFTRPTHTRILLASHSIISASAKMLLPPLPLGPFEIGPSEERIAAFLHDKRLHEDDIISVLAMKYTTPEFLELIAETAVSRRWTRVWCLLFPTVQKQLLHLEGRSSNGLYTGEVVEEGVVLVGWGGDSGESPQASSKKLEQEKAVARFPSYLEQHTVADIGRGFVYDSNGDCGNGNLILDAIHAGVNDADNAIVQAAMFDRADMVKWLLFRGIFLPSSAAVANSFNLVSLPGLAAALILAAKHPGTLSTLSLLLMHPLVDPNAHDGSPLAWSCRMGSLSAVKLLIQHGADASLKHGMAGLWAAEHGQTEVVKYLVSKGLIDIHAQEEYGLRWAVARGHIETVRYLCNAGAAVDAMDGFALRHAVQMGHEEIIDILLASGADVLIASRQADVREGVYTSSTARLEENSLVLWALRAGNNSLADKLVASLRASIARSRVCVVDLEE